VPFGTGLALPHLHWCACVGVRVCARAQLVAELQKNLEVLDRIYPKLKIDLVMVQGTPTPCTRWYPPVRPARAATLRTRRQLRDLVTKTVAAAWALADAKRAKGVYLMSNSTVP